MRLMPALRILGIDTSLRSTGLGVVERDGNRWRAIRHMTLKNPSSWPHSRCLKRISDEIQDLITETRPDAASIEGIFHFKSSRTAVVLGEARGAAIASCAGSGLSIYEYSPRKVKQSICGSGAAHKEQVARMIAGMLALTNVPPNDETDALAIAICHINSLSSVASLAPKEI